MQFYGLDDFLGTVSEFTRTPTDNLPGHIVDMDRAIAALREAGGLPAAREHRLEVAGKAARLLMALVRLHPVRYGINGEIAIAATRDYLAARGYLLRFRKSSAPSILVDQIEDDRLPLDDVRRALYHSISPAPNRPDSLVEPPLRGISICVAGGPGEHGSAEFVAELDRQLRALGARARLPQPRPPAAAPTEPAVISAVTTSDGLLVVTAAGTTEPLESDFAKRLAMPQVTLRTGAGPARGGWHRTVAPCGDLAGTVTAVLAKIRQLEPLLRDFAAYRRAADRKNAHLLAYLSGSWRALDRQQRAVVCEACRLSGPQIDSYLLNGVALELASCRERQDLELALWAPPPPTGQPHDFSGAERRLLATAATELGLDSHRLLDAMARVAVRMSQPLARRRMRTAEDARAALLDALSTPEPGAPESGGTGSGGTGSGDRG